jgi:hypothetical protein
MDCRLGWELHDIRPSLESLAESGSWGSHSRDGIIPTQQMRWSVKARIPQLMHT